MPHSEFIPFHKLAGGSPSSQETPEEGATSGLNKELAGHRPVSLTPPFLQRLPPAPTPLLAFLIKRLQCCFKHEFALRIVRGQTEHLRQRAVNLKFYLHTQL